MGALTYLRGLPEEGRRAGGGGGSRAVGGPPAGRQGPSQWRKQYLLLGNSSGKRYHCVLTVRKSFRH